MRKVRENIGNQGDGPSGIPGLTVGCRPVDICAARWRRHHRSRWRCTSGRHSSCAGNRSRKGPGSACHARSPCPERPIPLRKSLRPPDRARSGNAEQFRNARAACRQCLNPITWTSRTSRNCAICAPCALCPYLHAPILHHTYGASESLRRHSDSSSKRGA